MQKQLIIWPLLVVFSVALNVVPARQASAGRDLSPYCIGTSPRREVVVEVNNQSFVPDSVLVSEGECIELIVRAADGDSHSLAIDGSDITSEGAPLINSAGRHIGRAVRRENVACRNCGPLAEGWFAKGETILLMFQVNTPGDYRLQCRKGMYMVIEAGPAPFTSAQ